MLNCELFSAFTLCTTTAFVWHGREWSFDRLALVSFLPGLFAPWFAGPNFSSTVIGMGPGKSNDALKYAVMGGLLAMGIVASASGIIYILGWGKMDERKQVRDVHSLASGLLRVVAEEVGWRCFFLPCLLNNYTNKRSAILAHGVLWTVWQMPLIITMLWRSGRVHPVRTVVLHALFCLLMSVPYAWLAIKSDFSLWGSTLMHFTWNRIQPVVLGCLHTGEHGQMAGDLWRVNGEALVGCIILLPMDVLLLNALSFR